MRAYICVCVWLGILFLLSVNNDIVVVCCGSDPQPVFQVEVCDVAMSLYRIIQANLVPVITLRNSVTVTGLHGYQTVTETDSDQTI